MSLVAYASSDSEEENETHHNITNLNCVDNFQGFSKKRETVKITIPSLTEFKDEEPDEAPKKKMVYQGGSSLFSMLPPPKNSSTLSKPGFTPYVLSKKQESRSTSSKSNDTKKSVGINSSSKSTVSSSQDNDRTKFEEDDDVVTSSELEHSKDHDFFSLNADETLSKNVDTSLANEHSIEVSVPSVLFQETEMNFATSDVSQSFEEPGCFQYEEYPVVENNSTYISTSVANNDAVLKQEPSLSDEAFLKLQGRRKKFEDVNIIDVKADDQLTDKKEWLMKSLTQEVEHRPFKRRHDMPTQQQKRKHQITYLAFQAKEREMDLKNQWALNSRTRRETQAKYGF